MADNTKDLIFIGETGIVQEWTLKDTNPDTLVLEPFNLNGWTITMTATKQKSRTVMLNALPCVPDPDQTANTGKLTCTFDAVTATHPNLKKSICNTQFKAVDPDGDTHYFPKKFAKRYATIEFENALS